MRDRFVGLQGCYSPLREENVPVSRFGNLIEGKVRPLSLLSHPHHPTRQKMLAGHHQAQNTSDQPACGSSYADACPLSFLRDRGRLPQVGVGRPLACGRRAASCLVGEQHKSSGWLVSSQWCPFHCFQCRIQTATTWFSPRPRDTPLQELETDASLVLWGPHVHQKPC